MVKVVLRKIVGRFIYPNSHIKVKYPHQPTPRRKRKALRTETLSHKFEKATERSSFRILGGVVVLVCKLEAVGGLGAKNLFAFLFA